MYVFHQRQKEGVFVAQWPGIEAIIGEQERANLYSRVNGPIFIYIYVSRTVQRNLIGWFN